MTNIEKNIEYFIDSRVEQRRDAIENSTSKRMVAVEEQFEKLDLNHKEYFDLWQEVANK